MSLKFIISENKLKISNELLIIWIRVHEKKFSHVWLFTTKKAIPQFPDLSALN